MIEADHGATRRFRNHVVVDQRGARAGHTDTPIPTKALRITLPDYGDVAEIFAPARHDPERGRVLDHIAGHGGVRLDIDADAGVVVGCRADGALREQIG